MQNIDPNLRKKLVDLLRDNDNTLPLDEVVNLGEFGDRADVTDLAISTYASDGIISCEYGKDQKHHLVLHDKD